MNGSPDHCGSFGCCCFSTFSRLACSSHGPAASGLCPIKDVYVGEVWVCSGQSNMEWELRKSAKGEEVIAGSKNPRIRLFHVARKISAEPVHEVKAKWQECGPGAVDRFSAVGYYFGRDLEKALLKYLRTSPTCSAVKEV